MGKKIKSFATLLVALTTAFSIAALVSCSDDSTDPVDPDPSTEVETATLVSIEITTLPNKTTFNVDETFRYSGMEVTATYDDESTRVVTGYTVETPDMSTPGEKEVTVSYTEGTVTATDTYTITVEALEYVSISISSSWTLQVGMEVANINPTVYGTLNTAQTQTLSADLYTVSITDGDNNPVSDTYIQGESTYIVTVTLNEDPSLTSTQSYTTGSATNFRYEAEDAEANGVNQYQAGHSHGYFSSSMGLAWTSDGGTYSGGTLTFTVYALEGNYDLSFNAGSMLCYSTLSESSVDYGLGHMKNYDQVPNAVNDTVDLKVNGVEVEIPDTAVFTDIIWDHNSLSTFLNNFQEIELTNVALQNGANEVEFTFGNSKSGITNRWSNPPSFNVDYIEFTKDEPESKTMTSIEVDTMPWVTVYNLGEELDTRGMLLKATYDDSSTAYIANNYTTSYDNTTAGTKDVTVTYNNLTTTYEVEVRGDPNSIQIDDSFMLFAGDDLSALDLTVYGLYGENSVELDSSLYTVSVTDEDGGAVSEETAQFGKKYMITVTYHSTVEGGEDLTASITCSAKYKENAEDAYEIHQGSVNTNNNGNQYVCFDLATNNANKYESGYIIFKTPELETAGTYNISFEVINGYITSGNSSSSFNISNVVDVTVNDQAHDISDVVLEGYSNSGNSSSIYNDEFIQLADFGDVTLNAGENTIRLDVTYKSDYVNRWSAVLFSIDTFILTQV